MAKGQFTLNVQPTAIDYPSDSIDLEIFFKSFNPCPMGSECHNLNCELCGHICNAFSLSRKTVKVQKKIFEILYYLDIDIITMHRFFSNTNRSKEEN